MKYLFSIPDVSDLRMMNKILLHILTEHKEWFYDDFVIETAYGCPEGCIWNGNRVATFVPKFDKFGETMDLYKASGVQYRLTFTNFLLKPEHLFDTYGNKIARMLNKTGGYVMVSTDLMAEYMEKYPNLQICWSTTTDFGNTQDAIIDKINELSADHIVVLPYEFNNTEDLHKFIHPHNLEVLLNEKCVDHCQTRRQHWEICNRVALLEDDLPEFVCSHRQEYKDASIPRKHLIHRDMLQNYVDMGINHFKISGRSDILQALEAYFKFFVLPDHYNDFFEYGKQCNITNFGNGWEDKD